MSKVHVKTGDTVVILSGKDKGKRGKVLEVSPKEGKVIVEGCNFVTKHVKPRKVGQQGGIVKAEAPLYACKVMAIDSKTGKPSRHPERSDADTKKRRESKAVNGEQTV